MSYPLYLVHNDRNTVEKQNETTGRILLQRIYLAMKPLTLVDEQTKLKHIQSMDKLIKENVSKDNTEFCTLMWYRVVDIANAHRSTEPELSNFTFMLDKLAHAMKIITKGNSNESNNH